MTNKQQAAKQIANLLLELRPKDGIARYIYWLKEKRWYEIYYYLGSILSFISIIVFILTLFILLISYIL